MISATIIFFSPTGNTRKVCEVIKNTLDKEFQTKLCDITYPAAREKLLSENLSGDLLVVAVPVYAESVEEIITNFFRMAQLNFAKAIVICTYGCISAGAAISDIIRVLKYKNISVIASAKIPARHNFALAGIKDLSDKNSYDYSTLISDFIVKACKKNDKLKQRYRLHFSKLIPHKILVRLTSYVPSTNLEICSKCNICVKVCPTGAIKSDVTTDKNACISCAACVINCQTEARKLVFRSKIPKIYLKHGIENSIRKQIKPNFYL
ncbi:MAG: hypothetical protein A2Y15_03655 [Clostridiales bacterium GWF2_36_10]|nr:MAG: hypothetical protein A2Y15_03655 [Clostridiales bacterium GWF2_36_10]HAN21683.1 hypothetical protein [Clostridiales bacterium]